MIKITNKKLILFVVILFVLLLASAFLLKSFSGGASQVLIKKDGKTVEKINLTKVENPYRVSLGTNTVLIEKEGVTMLNSSCPDKHCINTGRISKKNESIVCLPNRVVVEFSDKKGSVDAVAGAR